jgi:hypothetical protein
MIRTERSIVIERPADKGFDVRSTMTFEPDGEAATRATEVLEMRLSGFVRLFEPMIRRQVPGQAEEIQARLKEVLEFASSPKADSI